MHLSLFGWALVIVVGAPIALGVLWFAFMAVVYLVGIPAMWIKERTAKGR